VLFRQSIQSSDTIVVGPDGIVSSAWIGDCDRAWLESERLAAFPHRVVRACPVGTAVDQEILRREVAGFACCTRRRTTHRNSSVEPSRRAGNRCFPQGELFFKRAAGALGRESEDQLQPVGIEGARQDVVDRDAVLRDLAGPARRRNRSARCGRR